MPGVEHRRAKGASPGSRLAALRKAAVTERALGARWAGREWNGRGVSLGCAHAKKSNCGGQTRPAGAQWESVKGAPAIHV